MYFGEGQRREARILGIQKTVITAAGLGIRLLPATLELPKEMFPFCVYDSHGTPCTKPMIQLVFESLYYHGFRNYCFVVDRRRRSVEDFFTEDRQLLDLLSKTDNGVADQLNDFFKKLSSSELSFVRQPEPLGFGDAILKSRHFAGDDEFLLHAGDDVILSEGNDHLRRLEVGFRDHGAAMACLLGQADEPQLYGAVTGEDLGDGCLMIDSVEEKPAHPKSNTVVIAVYAFKPIVFNYLQEAKSRALPERELEFAVRRMLADGLPFVGVKLAKDERRVDVGSPLAYLAAMDSVLKRSLPANVLS